MDLTQKSQLEPEVQLLMTKREMPQENRFSHWTTPLVVVATVLAALLVPQVGYAQDNAPTEQVREIARQISCPLCAGESLDVCTLRACEQMRESIAEKLALGMSASAIKADFVKMYGPQVLIDGRSAGTAARPIAVANDTAMRLTRVEYLLIAVVVLLVIIVIILMLRRPAKNRE